MMLKEKDFVYFKKQCAYWIDKFGLTDWDISYEFGGLEDHNGGGCMANYVACHAIIKLHPSFDDDYLISKEQYLKTNALHEVLELLLIPMQILAESREWNYAEYEHQRHRIIQRLSKVLEEK